MGRPLGPRCALERLVGYFVRQDFFGLVGYLGIDVDDALAIAEQVDV